MASNGVVNQGRRIGGRSADFAVGNEAGFDEGLEAVADAENQAIPVLKEIHDGVGHTRAADNGGDEFRGAIGFVASAEAAGKHQDLRAADLSCQSGKRFLDVSRG